MKQRTEMQKKMNQSEKKYKKVMIGAAAFIAVLVVLSTESCASTKDVVSVYTPIDYTADDAVTAEINRIGELPQEESVKALWHAQLLVQNTKENARAQDELARCEQTVADLYEKSLADKQYIDSLRYYKFLKACNYKDLSLLEKNEDELSSLVLEAVPGLHNNAEEKDGTEKVSSFIKGTVTVLVDRGLKIGKGFFF